MPSIYWMLLLLWWTNSVFSSAQLQLPPTDTSTTPLTLAEQEAATNALITSLKPTPQILRYPPGKLLWDTLTAVDVFHIAPTDTLELRYTTIAHPYQLLAYPDLLRILNNNAYLSPYHHCLTKVEAMRRGQPVQMRRNHYKAIGQVDNSNYHSPAVIVEDPIPLEEALFGELDSFTRATARYPFVTINNIERMFDRQQYFKLLVEYSALYDQLPSTNGDLRSMMRYCYLQLSVEKAYQDWKQDPTDLIKKRTWKSAQANRQYYKRRWKKSIKTNTTSTFTEQAAYWCSIHEEVLKQYEREQELWANFSQQAYLEFMQAQSYLLDTLGINYRPAEQVAYDYWMAQKNLDSLMTYYPARQAEFMGELFWDTTTTIEEGKALLAAEQQPARYRHRQLQQYVQVRQLDSLEHYFPEMEQAICQYLYSCKTFEEAQRVFRGERPAPDYFGDGPYKYSYITSSGIGKWIQRAYTYNYQKIPRYPFKPVQQPAASFCAFLAAAPAHARFYYYDYFSNRLYTGQYAQPPASWQPWTPVCFPEFNSGWVFSFYVDATGNVQAAFYQDYSYQKPKTPVLFNYTTYTPEEFVETLARKITVRR